MENYATENSRNKTQKEITIMNTTRDYCKEKSILICRNKIWAGKLRYLLNKNEKHCLG